MKPGGLLSGVTKQSVTKHLSVSEVNLCSRQDAKIQELKLTCT